LGVLKSHFFCFLLLISSAVRKAPRQQIRADYQAGGIGMHALAKRYGVSLGTVQACLREAAQQARA
jgi:hypothetical protein